MLDKESEVTEFKEMMVQKVDKLELVLKKMAQVLAANTNYATMISGPSYHKTKLKFIQLSKMEKHKLLVVVVVEGNIIKNTMIDIEDNLSDEEVLNEVAEAIKAGEEDLQIYTSGATNIFKYPELSDGDKASRLIDTLEHKEVLQEFVAEVNSGTEEEAGIQVYIGDESPVQSMKDCSVVTANYDLGGGLRGTIGIIGPKRMDYEKVLGTLRNLMNQLDTAFKKDER